MNVQCWASQTGGPHLSRPSFNTYHTLAKSKTQGVKIFDIEIILVNNISLITSAYQKNNLAEVATCCIIIQKFTYRIPRSNPALAVTWLGGEHWHPWNGISHDLLETEISHIRNRKNIMSSAVMSFSSLGSNFLFSPRRTGWWKTESFWGRAPI